jgi:hypothetical protein
LSLAARHQQVEQDRAIRADARLRGLCLFSFITINWRGKPLRGYRTIVQLIAATTTGTGLKVRAELDDYCDIRIVFGNVLDWEFLDL